MRSRAYHDTHQHAQAVLNMLLAVEKVREREVEASRCRRGLDSRRKQRAAAGVMAGREVEKDEAVWAAVVEGLKEVVAASRLHGAKDADIPVALQYMHEWDQLHPKQKDESEEAEERQRAREEEAKEREKQRIIDKLKPQLNGGVRVMLPVAALPPRPLNDVAAASTPLKRWSEAAEPGAVVDGDSGMATPQSSEEPRRAAELIEKKRRADERRARLLREEAQLQEQEAAKQQQRALPPKPVSPRVKAAAAAGRSAPASPGAPSEHRRTEYQYPLPVLSSLSRVSITGDDDSSMGGSRRASGSMGQIMPLVGSSSAMPSARGSMDSGVEGSVAQRMAHEYDWPPKADRSQASSPQHQLGRSLGSTLQGVEQSNGSSIELQRADSAGELPADGSVTVEKDSSCCCVIS